MKKLINTLIKYIETLKFVVILKNFLYEHPSQLIIIPGGFLLLLVFSLDIIRRVSLDEMLSNLTSSVVEVFFLGFIIIAYNKLRERKESIKRYKEEINSYRPWKEAEATYRICGLVRSLNNFNVSDINLSGCYLPKAPLNQANLQRANLEKANLQEAHLNEANLQEAHLNEANLQGTYFSGANLYGADLRGANLNEADIRGAKLNGTYLRGANLQEADLKGIRLHGAHLSKVNFQGADLKGAYLQGADLKGAYLQGADLMGAYLQRADLSGANLQGANLDGIAVESSSWLEKYFIIGIEYIKENYCVVEYKIIEESFYQIKKK